MVLQNDVDFNLGYSDSEAPVKYPQGGIFWRVQYEQGLDKTVDQNPYSMVAGADGFGLFLI